MRTIHHAALASLAFCGAIATLPVDAQSTRGGSAVQHAKGSFEVRMTPEAQEPATDGGAPTARMGLAKTFSGDLQGTATGTMLAIGAPKPGEAASYVAVDQVRGTLAGRTGGFVLTHRGTMTKTGEAALDVRISPDSGTGQLEGIAGTLTIDVRDGKHFYDLAYTLPGAAH